VSTQAQTGEEAKCNASADLIDAALAGGGGSITPQLFRQLHISPCHAMLDNFFSGGGGMVMGGVGVVKRGGGGEGGWGEGEPRPPTLLFSPCVGKELVVRGGYNTNSQKSKLHSGFTLKKIRNKKMIGKTSQVSKLQRGLGE
jgi:hypothetical protein